MALCLLGFAHAAWANTASTVQGSASDLGVAAAYTSNSLATSTNDVTFASATTYTNAATLGLSAASLSVGTLDDLNGAALTITSSNSKTLTINGGSDSVAGSSAADLFYLASGASLTYNGAVAISATSGNFDVGSGGSLTLNLPGVPTSATLLLPNPTGSTALAFTGAGATTINGVMTFDSSFAGVSTPSLVTLSNSGTGLVTFGTVQLSQSSGTVNANLTVNAVNGPITFGGIRSSGDDTTLTLQGGNSIVLNTGTANFSSPYTGSLLDGGEGSFFVIENGATTSVTLNNIENTQGTGGAANTYTLNAGTLNLNLAGNLLGVLTINGGTLNNTSGSSNTGSGEAGNQFAASFGWGGSNALTLSGTTVLEGAITITTAGTAALTLSGGISGAGESLAEAGTGVLALSASNSFTGGVTVSGGQLNINNANALGSGALTITSGTIGNTSSGTLTINNAENWNGSFGVVGTHALSSGTGAITLGSGASVTVTSSTFTATGIISGPGQSLTEAGTGLLILNNTNTYSGGTTISGNLQVGTGSAENVASLGTGTITVNSGGTLDLTPGSSSSTFNYANNFILNGGTIFGTDGVQHLGTSGSSTIDIASGGGTVESRWNSKDVYLDGQLIDSGTLTIQNAGGGSNGAVHIGNNSNTYSGTVTLNAALNLGEQLSVDGTTALQFANVNVIGSNGSTSGLAFNGGTTPVLGALEGTGNIAIPSGYSLTVGNNNAGTTYSGALTSSGSLIKAGSGTFVLDGTGNSFSGGLTINNGVVQAGLSGSNVWGTGVITFGASNTPTLDLNGQNVTSALLSGGTNAVVTNSAASTTGTLSLGTSGSQSFAGILQNGTPAGTLALTLNGGTEVLAGANTYTGATTVSAGTLQIGNGSAGSISNSSSASVSSGATLAFDESNGSTQTNAIADAGTVAGVEGTGITNTLSGNIAGAGAVSVTGAGTLALAGSNTYIGATTVSAGTLQLNGFSAMSGSSALTLVSGATVSLLADTTGTFSPAGIALPSSSNTTLNFNVNDLTTASNNTLTLSGSLTYATSSGSEANTINVTGGNGYSLTLAAISLPSTVGSGDTTNTLAINANSANLNIGTLALGSYGEGVTFGGSQTITVAVISQSSNGSSTLAVGNGSNTPTVTITGAAIGTNNRTTGFFDTSVNNGATLNLNNSSALYNGGSSQTPTVTVNTGGTVILYDTPATDTYSSTSFSDSFTLNGGTLINYDNLNQISGLTVNAAGGALEGTFFNNSGNRRSLNITGAINGTGNLTVGYSGLGVVTGSNAGSIVRIEASGGNYSGTLTIDPTTLTSGSGGSYLIIDTGGATAFENATVNLAGNNPSSAAFYGSQGGSTLVFNDSSGANSYTMYAGALTGSGNLALNIVNVPSSGIGLYIGGNNASTTYSGILSGMGGVNKSGTGAFTVSGANTYSGGTTVSGGALIVSGSLSGSGAVTVDGGATLGGGGKITGSVTVETSGTLEPGFAETTLAGATLALNSGLTLSGTSTLALNLDSSNNIDSLAITGALSIGANDTLTVNLLNGAALNQATYTIVTYTGLETGTFATTNLPSNYAVEYGVGGDSIELVAVPEPGAFGTVLAGLGMLVGIQRWRKPRVGTWGRHSGEASPVLGAGEANPHDWRTVIGLWRR